MYAIISLLFLIPNGLNSMPIRSIRALDNEEFSLESGLKYLHQFGYDIPSLDGDTQPQLSQEKVEGAISDFQEFHGLDVTGSLDDETVELMKTPRCGVKDRQSASYKVFGTKWDKRSLTYRVSKYSRSLKLKNSDVDFAVDKAFGMWQEQADISFKKKSSGRADIDIRFEKYGHGDGEAFDGPGRTLAHAFFPQHGALHMDDSEAWSINSYRGTDALQTLTHEIGHNLGLDHSRDRSSIMWAYSRPYQPSLKLEQDDIRGIQALYGRRSAVGGTNDDEDDTEETLARKLQTFLSSAGFNPGYIDGSWGRVTTRALQRYLNSQGANLRVDGDFGRLTVRSLQEHLNSRGAGLRVDGHFGARTKKALLDLVS